MRETVSSRVSGSLRRASVIGVAIGPGWTELARMRSFAYWMAVALVSRRTDPFEAWYCGLELSTPTRPSCDEIFTMAPPPARRMARVAALGPGRRAGE